MHGRGSSAIDVTYKWGHSDKLQHVSTQTVKLPAPVHTFAGLGHSSALAFVSSDGSSLCLVGWPGEAPKVGQRSSASRPLLKRAPSLVIEHCLVIK